MAPSRLGQVLRGAAVAVTAVSSATAQQPGIYLGPGPQPYFPLAEPTSPVLTLDRDRMFAESAFGRRVAREVQVATEALSAENRRIEEELTYEERALTERRAEMDPDEFRELADAFDAKVTELRRRQDTKARALQLRDDGERQAFVQAALPVLAELVADLGATVILDERAVFFSSETIDVTDRAIKRIDAAIGDGAGLSPPPPDPIRGDAVEDGTPGQVDGTSESVDLLPAEPRAAGTE